MQILQMLISLAVSVVTFAAIYQFVVPLFSGGGVSLRTVPLTHKLGFGLGMSLATTVAQFVLTLLAALTVIPLISLLIASLGATATPLMAIVVSLALGLTLMQLSNWASTVAMGRWMPQVINVSSKAAAFKAALAPTLIMGGFYILMMLYFTPVQS